MNKQEVRIECMTEILSELEISVTNDQIKQIVDDFSLHLEMENELSSYQHLGHKEECATCRRLESDVKQLEHDIEIYRKSVMYRRKTDTVYIENDTVMYEGR